MAYVFDLGDPTTNANPFPAFARLRAEDPVHWSPAMKAWIVTRYADVKQVALNNKQISADRLTPFFKTNAEYQALMREIDHNGLGPLLKPLRSPGAAAATAAKQRGCTKRPLSG